MKKIFLIIFILVGLFLYSSFAKVIAQVPTNQPLSLTVPGVNCGFAEDPVKNLCCHVDYPSSFIPPSFGIFGTITNTFGSFANSITQGILQPLINSVSNITYNNINTCYSGVQSTTSANDPNCRCINYVKPAPGYLSVLNDFCQRQSTISDRKACLACSNDGGVFSGIGCVKTDVKKFIEETVFGIGIGLAGGFSLLCIIYAAFMMQSSQGNPEKLKKAQELITSCIMGLMLIIFSVFILRLIGVNILRIPGFG